MANSRKRAKVNCFEVIHWTSVPAWLVLSWCLVLGYLMARRFWFTYVLSSVTDAVYSLVLDQRNILFATDILRSILSWMLTLDDTSIPNRPSGH